MKPLWNAMTAIALGSAIPFAAGVPHASAQEPAPLDIVRLKDGSMYRGTIVELVAGDHVEITLANGTVKRFPMSDVAYAGPFRPVRGSATSEPQPETVHFRASGDGAHFVLHDLTSRTVGETFGTVGGRGYAGRVASNTYRPLCAAPCTTALMPGVHVFAISSEDGDPIEVSDVEIPHHASTVTAQYESRAGTRTAGWFLFGGSALAGLGLAALGAVFQKKCPDFTYCDSYNYTFAGVGVGVALFGALVSYLLVSTKDEVRLRITPTAWLAPSIRGISDGQTSTRPSAPGLELALDL